MRILSVKHINVFITLSIFLFLLTTSAFAIFTCPNGKERCCSGGVQSCCDPLPCPDPIHQPCEKYDLKCFSDLQPLGNDPVVDPIDTTNCTAGTTKYRYTADDGCSFKTETKECCSDGKWTPFVESPDIPHCCSGALCWNGSTCQTPAPQTETVSPPAGYRNVSQCTYLHYPENCVYGQGFQYASEGTLAGCSCDTANGYSNFDKDAKRCYKCEWVNDSVADIGGQYNTESAACANFTIYSEWNKSNGNPTYQQWKSHGDYRNNYSCTPIHKNSGSYHYWSASYNREFFTCH